MTERELLELAVACASYLAGWCGAEHRTEEKDEPALMLLARLEAQVDPERYGRTGQAWCFTPIDPPSWLLAP